MTDNQKDPRNEQTGSGSQQSQQGNRRETDPNNPTAKQQPGNQSGRSEQGSERQDPSAKRGKTGTGVDEGNERGEEIDEDEENSERQRSERNQPVGNQNTRKDQ